MISRTFRRYEPDQMLLMPPSLKEWLPEGHLAYFVMDVVAGLDLSKVIESYGGPARGTVPYEPRMMVSLLVYGYSVGVVSSRRIARGLDEDVAFRVIGAGERPDFRTISDFRKEHLEELKGLFVQVLKLCMKAGLVKLGKVALDGTKVKANASKHKAMSYERMTKEEARLKTEVDNLLKQAAEIDEREDAEYGREKRGDELPEELAYRESRLKKIQEAKEALEQEAREAAEERKAEIAEREKQENKRGRKPSAPDPAPDPKAQKNFTDPESRIMPASGEKRSFVQGYNCQAAVDGEHQVIVAEDVTQETNDKQQAVPLLEQVKGNTGKNPKQALMDAGYYSQDNIEEGSALAGELFIPPDRMKHGEEISEAPRGRIPESISVADRMRRKLRTKRGRAVYGKRKEIVEPVFGQIKQVRGFRQFLLRGLRKVKGEWSLICTTHNILKLWRTHDISAGKPPGMQVLALSG